MADEKGRVIIINCSSFVDSLDIIKQLTDNEEPFSECISSSVSAYPWKVQNKYYTADIQLCCVNPKSLPTGTSLDTDLFFEAVIIIFDITQSSSFEDVKTWIPYLESKDPSVMLLLNTWQGNDNDEKGNTREDVLRWCIQNTFEMVDLIEDSEVIDTQDDFQDKTGLERVKEALNCAEWPNIQMRDNPLRVNINGNKNGNQTCENKEKECAATNGNTSDTENVEIHSTELDLLEGLSNEEPDGENFEELFQKMKFMKDRATALPDRERKAYAEKVALAFWKALGGDEDEVSGLSSDEQ